ncbi:hypothetical protein ACFWP7_05300 [Streptomyces sp. NPDC058470]|uniref:hypothetical protein n=1 Tax=Streptomyces sp. NPDC058470 TaxID=3346515 RepID=UPI0036536236
MFVAPDGQRGTSSENRAVIEKFPAEGSDGLQVGCAVSSFRAKAVSEDASTAYSTAR